ncbi:MAG: hypothetical protein ACLQVL_14345 [Terriglobia bacterium]
MNILFALEEEFKLDIPHIVVRDRRGVRHVVDAFSRVLEGKDVSDLAAMAKSGTPAATG